MTRIFAALALLPMAMPIASAAQPAIDVLSNRPDLVSGGDVLIEVVLPPGTPEASVQLLVDGALAQATHGIDAAGRYLARVTNVSVGAHVLSAAARRCRGQCRRRE